MKREQHLQELAEESLDTFAEIANSAGAMLVGSGGGSPDSLIKSNTLTDNRAVQNIQKISTSTREGYQALTREPAISRVIAESEDGQLKTFYISRTIALHLQGGKALASYHSPIGRLASLAVGDDATITILDKQHKYYILEKIYYHPVHVDGGWDSTLNIFEHEELGTLTIESLLAMLGRDGQVSEDELNQLLSGDTVTEGLRHQLRTAMALRDQPILDKFQDTIFRLPIDSQMIILGPPGTGKTTTLIKRLGQKLDISNLEESEQKLTVDDPAGLPHKSSWLVFTPSELLMHYVKEAFSREQIPAPSERIKTWDSHRKHLARNVFGILRSNTTNGRFIPKEDNRLLKEDVIQEPRAWYEAFAIFHRQRVLGQLTQGISIAASASSSDNKPLIADIERILKKAKPDMLVSIYNGLSTFEAKVANVIASSKEQTDKLIRKELVIQFNNNKKFLQELGRYLESIDLDDDEEDDDRFDEDEQDELTPQTQTDIQRAEKAYNTSIRNLSRYKFLKKTIPKTSRAARIRDWLGHRVPDDKVLADVGQGISLQNGLRRFNNSSRRYLVEASASYSVFRKQSFKENRYYKTLPENARHIGLLEMDALILLILKCARELLTQSFVSRNLQDPRFYILNSIASQFKNQILVDEATDFSPLQLACMENLTQLKTRSFFACGDFNQRVTGYGIRSLEQVKWVSNRIEDYPITIVYRQSRLLNEFARKLLEATGGNMSTLGNLPESSVHTGVQPVLLENATDLERTSHWLFERINEIEKSVQMPSIAVLVNSEDQVKLIAEALDPFLEEISLRAVPCLEGQTLGEGNDVRVFDVQHIKGLEFEAVFFVGIDNLAISMPDLFDKYLYVGTTRAASYLGMTCEGTLPTILEALRDSFVDDWKPPSKT